MPYQLTWRENGIHWQFYGDVTAREISVANEEFFRDERSDSAKFQIIDVRDVSSVEWNENQIKETAAHDRGAESFIKNLKVAYISKEPRIISKLEKYIEISKKLHTSWNFKGFEDFESAKVWVEK